MIQIQCIALVQYANLKKPSLFVSLFLHLLHLFQNHVHFTFCLHSVWGTNTPMDQNWQKLQKLFAMQTWTLSNVLHQQDHQILQFLIKEKRKSRHFWQNNWEWRMFSSSILNRFSVFVQLSNLVFCENASLNSANFTERVFFAKTLYTSAIRDKFCVCCNIIFG